MKNNDNDILNQDGNGIEISKNRNWRSEAKKRELTNAAIQNMKRNKCL